MLVEFVGLPGSGKTSLVIATHERMRARGFVTKGLREAAKSGVKAVRDRGTIGFLKRPERICLYGALEFRKAHPKVFDALCASQSDTPHLTPWTMDVLSHLYYVSEQSRYDGGFILCDEGLVHRGVASFIGTKGTRAFAAYNKALPDNFILVNLAVPPETALERSGARRKGTPALRHQPHRDPLDVLRENAALIERACKARRARGLQVIEIDGTAPLETCTEQLCEALVAEMAGGLQAAS